MNIKIPVHQRKHAMNSQSNEHQSGTHAFLNKLDLELFDSSTRMITKDVWMITMVDMFTGLIVGFTVFRMATVVHPKS